jgi:hypothetical protein
MKDIKKYMLFLAAAAATTLGSVAQAEYRLEVFGVDLTQVEARGSVQHLDFATANDFCVSQIVSGDFQVAIETCSEALVLLRKDRGISLRDKRRAKAVIYSNRGVARARNGDLAGASADFDTGLDSNSADEILNANIEEVSKGFVASNQ